MSFAAADGQNSVTLGTIDALARLRLAARRLGIDVRVREAPDELCDLACFLGLAEALGLEPRRQPEEREERLGVEEEGKLDDPALP
jgi:hypothetical protein